MALFGARSNTQNYWLGMEDSAAVYKSHLFIADNGGHLMCLNLNTLHLVWVQDILDDSNSTPVLSVENERLYLYVSTSFHLGWRSSGTAPVPIWKIDAETGEILWQTEYECHSEEGVSAVFNPQSRLELIACPTISMSLSPRQKIMQPASGLLKKGLQDEIAWEHKAGYAWSSPVCVYNTDGTGKVIYCSTVEM